jgi:RND superfamily putative drug exporter
MPERWTRSVLRHRLAVLLCWGAVLVGGVLAFRELPSLLTNSFTVPGTDSDRAATLLGNGFNERPEGTFIVVFRVRHPSDRGLQRRLHGRLVAAARDVPTGQARELQRGGGILYGEIATRLGLKAAKRYTDALRSSLREGAGPRGLVTGQPAIQHDLDPVLASDLRRAEAVAVPAAVIVLLLVFGLSLAVAIPFLFAACAVGGALAAVYATAHLLPTTTYVTNLVTLIGFGLAIDYSLLIVHRFREELRKGAAEDEAVVRTMATAGRTVVFSGTSVAIGLGLLLLVPIPFIRSMGAGGLVVPLSSIAAALTLQPVLLSLLGARGLASPRTPGASSRIGFWERLARSIVHRRGRVLVGATTLLLLLSVPVLWLRLVPGSFAAIPAAPESGQGLALLRNGVGPGALTPTHVVVDAGVEGGVRRQPVRGAVSRLADELFHDPEVLVVASGMRPPYTDGTARYARVVVVGRHEYGAEQSQSFVRRLRTRLVPRAGFPAGVTVAAGGAPPQGVDFLATTYAAFPWLVLAVLVVTYLTLLRAFRSLLLPLKAVLLNLLTVAAVYGLLVLVFQWGVGSGLLGLRQTGDVEGWIPIFLFATLFGLSMDYEVFLVTRMRESWDHVPDSTRAVAHGLERTGRIVTAAALIMVAAFTGFVAGQVPGLQQLGLGLALAVLLDATIVRMLLVPSLMAVLGRWNWWLPERVARLARVPPSTLYEKA